MAGDTVPETTILEKERVIYGDLQEKVPTTSKETAEDTFMASDDWFENFEKTTIIQWEMRHGEDESAGVKEAEEYNRCLAQLVAKEGYIRQQVLCCDETGLLGMKMPRTYITVEAMELPGHKLMKDGLTLALCANASGDCNV